jgi:hypothetical protein
MVETFFIRANMVGKNIPKILFSGNKGKEIKGWLIDRGRFTH